MSTTEQQLRIVQTLQELAPNGEAQEKVTRLYHDLQGTYGIGNNHQVLKALVGRLYDGLAYGNWPWLDWTVQSIIGDPANRGSRERL